MKINRQMLADKLTAYLHHELSLTELVEWAEEAMQKGDFDETDYGVLREIIGRLGLADVNAFGLTWEDFVHFFDQLGYTIQLQVYART